METPSRNHTLAERATRKCSEYAGSRNAEEQGALAFARRNTDVFGARKSWITGAWEGRAAGALAIHARVSGLSAEFCALLAGHAPHLSAPLLTR